MTKAKPYLRIILLLLILCILLSNPLINTSAVAYAATIKINHSKISIPVNTTKQLSITGTSKKVTWTTNNKSVAMVNSIGIVTAKSEGTATITASVSGKALTCKVTAYIPMIISSSSITLNAGKSETLEVIGTTKTPVWSSNNKSIAKVSKNGTVTAISKGSTVITAMIGTKKLACKITVIDSIAISNKSIKLTEGQSQSLKIKGITYRATWSTSNSSVATVSIFGTITALKTGKATVTAYVDGEKYPCTVTVYKDSRISENSIILKTGEKTITLQPPIVTQAPISQAPITQAPVEPIIPVVTDNSENSNSSTETGTITPGKSTLLDDPITTDITETSNESASSNESPNPNESKFTDNPTTSDDGYTTSDGSTVSGSSDTLGDSTTSDETATIVGLMLTNSSPIDNYNNADSNIITDSTTLTDSTTTTDNDNQEPTLLWTSSDTNVAIVSNNGIVKGVKPGTAIITATYGEQKFTYLVIILSKYNSFLSKAPFPAYQKSWDKVNYLLPSNWNAENNQYSENADTFAYPNYGNSSIYISIEKNETYAPAFHTIRNDLKEIFSLENINLAYKYSLMNTGYQFKIKNYIQKEVQTDIGKVIKSKLIVTIDGESVVQTFYNFWISKYYIEMIVTDDQSGRYDVQKMSEYILNTITIEN